MPPAVFEKLVDDFWVSCIVGHMRGKTSGWKLKEQISDQEIEQVDSIGVQVRI